MATTLETLPREVTSRHVGTLPCVDCHPPPLFSQPSGGAKEIIIKSFP